MCSCLSVLSAGASIENEKTYKPIGEMKFHEIYQKKGERASVSEWFTRTSGQVTKKLD